MDSCSFLGYRCRSYRFWETFKGSNGKVDILSIYQFPLHPQHWNQTRWKYEEKYLKTKTSIFCLVSDTTWQHVTKTDSPASNNFMFRPQHPSLILSRLQTWSCRNIFCRDVEIFLPTCAKLFCVDCAQQLLNWRGFLSRPFYRKQFSDKTVKCHVSKLHN